MVEARILGREYQWTNRNRTRLASVDRPEFPRKEVVFFSDMYCLLLLLF